MEKPQSVNVYLNRSDVNRSALFFAQGDAGVYPLRIRLRDSNGPFKIPPGTAFYPKFVTPSGAKFQGAAAIIADAAAGELLYSVRPEEIAEPGEYEVEIKAYKALKQLTFQRFTYSVRAAVMPPYVATPPVYAEPLDALISELQAVTARVGALESAGGGLMGPKGDKGDKGDSGGGSDGNYIHLSVDDVSICLASVKANAAAWSSVFQNAFFGGLKALHDTYGATASLYCYADDAAGLPSKFAAELAQNADWLKFRLHSKNSGHNFADETAAVSSQIYNAFINSILEFTGSVSAVDRIPRLHEFLGSLAAMRAMRDCPCGLLGALTPEAENPDSSLNDRAAYYLTSVQRQWVKGHAKLIDYTNGMLFYHTAMRTDWFDSPSSWGAVYPQSGGNLIAQLDLWNKQAGMADAMTALEIFGHEWNSGLLAQFQLACQWGQSRGIPFGFAQNASNGGIASAAIPQN